MTDGPFRFSRHPMYLGMVLVLIGVAVALGTVGPALVVVPLYCVLARFIAVEERAMAETFGDACQEYRSRARRWNSGA